MRTRRQSLHPFEADYLGQVAETLKPTVPVVVREAAVDYARNLMTNDYPVIFDLLHLSVVSGVEPVALSQMAANPEERYASFRLRKRQGGSRLIQAPQPELKAVQQWIQRRLTRHLPVHDAAHGFRMRRSIVTNAAPHVGQRLIVKIDITDFFPSVEKAVVFRIFRRAGYSRRVAEMLARLVTVDGRLPQGAPTSPDLANVAAFRMDARLSGLAANNDVSYTRYADDLTFSGDALGRPGLRRAIEYVVRECGFRPNDRKLRYLTPGDRQQVTGVVVNERISWPRPSRRWIRQEIHYLTRFGVEEHLRRRGYPYGAYKEHIYGHVYALFQLHPEEAAEHLDRLSAVAWPY